MRTNLFRHSLLYICVASLASCSLNRQEAKPLHLAAAIFPDYTDVTMPINIAPPTFSLADSLMLDQAQAVFTAGSLSVVVGNDGDDGFCIDIDDWNALKQAGTTINVLIQGKKDGEWVEYDSFPIHISSDSIDSHLVYRLIEPGYEVWNEMGIYQRNLENYDENAIITNRQTDGGCMNCHSFSQNSSDRMLLHLRLDHAGTYILHDGKMQKLILPEGSPSLTYPSWHPSGKCIAFSSNSTKQMFHTTDRNRIEVFDYSSDIYVCNVDEQGNVTYLSSPLLTSPSHFETFPAFAPDGKRLYYCSADSVPIPDEYDKAHYSLCSISFDAEKGTFGDTVDTLYNAHTQGGSISHPRVSPDGRFLLFTHHNYGNFSIWHREAKLMMIDLTNGNTIDISTLGAYTSSHSWSSTGRWISMASRRVNGLYSIPYISHISPDGKATKPFPVPQSDAAYYHRQMKSYNLPELVKGRVVEPELIP